MINNLLPTVSSTLAGHGDDGDCITSIAASLTSSSSSMKASNGVKSQNMNVKWNRDECQVDIPYSSFSSSKYRAEFVDSEGLKREKRLGGMRSVASAPDFSQLRRMHDTKATDAAQLKVHKRSITGVCKYYHILACFLSILYLT